MYSAQLLDHFQNPRNAGEVSQPDAVAQAENPVCGDVLRLTAKIDGTILSKVRFKAKGCVPAMACASALTELLEGRTFKEAAAVRPEDVVAAVGGLPEASSHAAHLAINALSVLLSGL